LFSLFNPKYSVVSSKNILSGDIYVCVDYHMKCSIATKMPKNRDRKPETTKTPPYPNPLPSRERGHSGNYMSSFRKRRTKAWLQMASRFTHNFFWRDSHFPLKVIQKERKKSLRSRKPAIHPRSRCQREKYP
jgi:hypothetical protein